MSLPALVRQHALTAVTVLLFALAVWRVGLAPELPAVLAFIFGGALLSVIDWRVHRLPTKLVYHTLAGVGAGLLFATLVTSRWAAFVTALAGAALLANVFFLVYIIGRNVVGVTLLGLGDVRLAAVLGLVLGWYGLPWVLYGVVAGNALALIVVIATCIREGGLQWQYSFGPPLIVGALAVVLVHG